MEWGWLVGRIILGPGRNLIRQVGSAALAILPSKLGTWDLQIIPANFGSVVGTIVCQPALAGRKADGRLAAAFALNLMS